VRFSGGFQAAVQGDQCLVPFEGRWHSGGIETFSHAITSTGDMAASFTFAAVVIEWGKPRESRHLFTRKGPKFGHADEQGKSGALADARHADSAPALNFAVLNPSRRVLPRAISSSICSMKVRCSAKAEISRLKKRRARELKRLVNT
jgi:hypothetical protein